MPHPLQTLTARFSDAIEAAFGTEHAGADPVLRRSDRADFQANAAMALAKKVGQPPRDVAAAIVEHLQADDIAERTEIAGPGFVNVWLRPEVLAQALAEMAEDDRLGVAFARRADNVVIDYSSPTLTKEMHIGHLRSTVIGDALARVLEFAGHAVVRQNHYGEWGTQFGMLIEHLSTLGGTGGEVSIEDLNVFYQDANSRFLNDEEFKERARQRVVSLQAGEPESVELWRQFVSAAVGHAEDVYDRLGVTLRPEDARPESSFNDELDALASELEASGVARIDEGALCAYPEGFKNRDGDPLAFMIRKSDGAYGYQATDLAALRHRVNDLKATRVIYVVDARQSQHLAMVFAVARVAGWVPDGVRIEHVAFGTVMGPDGKPFKSRSGENVKLGDVLDEAIDRAATAVSDKNPELSETERASIARIIGIGALKYADLSNDRIKDYVFDWNRMLAFEGNTAPYLQYAHARIRSIFRRAGVDGSDPHKVRIEQPAERALALQVLEFGDAVEAVADTLQPHRLAVYLFELASAFTTFYEQCPVLKADTEDERLSRLVLCDLTARTLARGLDLLGIQAPDRM